MKLLRKILKCSPGGCSWRYGFHDFNTIEGQLKYRFWRWVDWLRDRPRDWRWCLANRLAYWAAKLRGGKNYDLGYGCEGNLASMLEENLRWAVLMHNLHESDEDKLNDLYLEIELLAQLAKAQHFIAYWKIQEDNR